MSGVKERLDQLSETKINIKNAINELGGNIKDQDSFRSYPEQIQKVIDTTIIPQSDLNRLTQAAININNEVV